ncbi:CPBP family intramembrane glutamic endopeptidase [Simkania negevensis]|uniref:Putative membrane protein n=1 Tax=Simkania negevensis (strain ATCC VR-1471 / DSM 27360 / Z) TaxID=331113 RepID=F8L909_SIMNZ|nr:CPBP family intramembrane glutamic endopeptidase [Simkania negevensis]CCB89318.1 putative membrane protein [Simkania negevensis Z]
MEEVIIEHLEQAGLFALMGAIVTWIAKKCGFFKLGESSPAPRIQYPIIGILLYLVLFIFAVPFALKFFSLVYSPLETAFQAHPALFIATVQVLSIMIITCFVIIFSLFQDQNVVKRIWKEQFTFPSAIKDFELGVLTWVISFSVVACVDQIGDLLTSLAFGTSRVEQIAVRFIRLSAESPYLLTVATISTVLAAPILEECIFRGFMQTYLKSKIGFIKALFSTAFIFAAFHFSPTQGISNITLILSLFTLALYLGFLYEKRKSLIAPIALHMTFNSISVIRIVLFSS